MRQMSDLWNDTITNQAISRKVKASVSISLGEAFVDNKLSVMASSYQPVTKLNQLNDGNLYPDYPFAALDGRWKLGDDKRLSSTLYMQTGYRGWATSDANGNFAASQYITVTFNTTKLIDQVDLSFDPRLNEYAVNFTLKFYNISGGLIGTWTLANNTASMRLLTSANMGTEPFQDVKSMRLDITKWSAPNTYAKVTELFGAREEGFTGSDRIISIDITTQAESTGSMDVGGVYAAKAVVVLDNSDKHFSNTDPYNSPYIKNKRMDISIGLEYPDGSTEFCSVGTFYIDNLNHDSNNLTVTINAQNIMREFTGRPYKKTEGLHYPATIAQIFEDVIIASELPMQYAADSICSQYTIPSEPDWGNNADCRQVLKQIAQVVNGRVYQDYDGIIRLAALIGTNASNAVDSFANPVMNIDPRAYFDLSGRTSDIDGVTRVTVSGANGTSVVRNVSEAEKMIGVTNYSVENPILKVSEATQTSLHSVTANNILQAYRYSTEMRTLNWRCNPAVEPGDVVRILTLDGMFYNARIAQTSLKYTGGLRGTLNVRAQSSAATVPEIEFYVADGELYYYIDPLFEAFFSAQIDSSGELIINAIGALTNANFEIDDKGFLVMTT